MEVLEGGPFINAKTKIRKGVIIEKIDGEDITADMDWARIAEQEDGQECLTEPI